VQDLTPLQQWKQHVLSSLFIWLPWGTMFAAGALGASETVQKALAVNALVWMIAPFVYIWIKRRGA